MSLLSSINTNTGAMVALESLNNTSAQLQVTQKRVSTGYNVADATDNGAAYAVAQSVRSDVSALTTANQALGGVQGLLSTTLSGLNNISNTLTSMRDVLVNLASSSTTSTQRAQYKEQFASYLKSVKDDVQGSGYNGATLINSLGGTSDTFARIAVVQNELGGTYGIATFSGSSFYNAISVMTTSLSNSTSVQAILTSTTATSFMSEFQSIGSALNSYGASVNYVNNQISFNSDKVDALNSGLGSLVDANMAQESALLQSLQIKQQLATQSLTIADQAPSVLLKLFGG